MITGIGRFCFRHRWWVLIGWLVAMVIGGASAGPLFGAINSAQAPPQNMEADDGGWVLSQHQSHSMRFDALVEGGDIGSAPARTALDRAAADVGAIPGVGEVSPPELGTEGKGAVLTVTLAKVDDPTVPLEAAKTRLTELGTDIPGASVRYGGLDLVAADTDQLAQSDLATASTLSLPVTLVVLVFIFGGVIAAGLPVLAALATMAGAFGLMFVASRFVDLENSVPTVVTLLGLGLSIDYGLLLIGRYREERAAGYGELDSVLRAWGTAGRTIMFSALTLSAALLGLLAIQAPRLQVLGVSGIATALVAMFASLTITGALLGVLGARVRPSEKALARQRAALAAGGAMDEPAQGFFARLAGATQRRPLLVTLGVTAVLLLAGAPLLNLTVKQLYPPAGVPPEIESVRVTEELATGYGRQPAPDLQVVARTDPDTLSAWAQRWRDDPEVAAIEPARAEGDGLSTVGIAVRGDPQAEGAKALLDRIRADRPEGGQSWVTGETAFLYDLLDEMARGIPLGIVVILVAMLVLQFLMTGSVVVPLTAVALNVLSLSATFGVLVLVFQEGWLAGLLGTLTLGGLDPLQLLVMFTFGFAFAMDYHVFLLTRIKEYVDRGYDTRTAIRYGLQGSGRIITLAALAMMIVFGCHAIGELSDLEQLGVGLFVAVLVDATVVRCLLVPAVMTLLGRWNWWSPRPLRKLHARFGLREQEPAARPAVPAATR